jgi:hypothetical protein
MGGAEAWKPLDKRLYLFVIPAEPLPNLFRKGSTVEGVNHCKVKLVPLLNKSVLMRCRMVMASERTTGRRSSYNGSPTLACLAWRDRIGSHVRMRTTLIIACAMVVFATGAHAQDALKPCRQIKDDGKRLKCYDRLDRSSSNAQERPGQSRPGGDTGWIITDEKSPLDDTPLVSAALASSDDRSHLLMRCKDRKTEVAVSSTGFIQCGPDVRVIYRIGQEQGVETHWRSHPSCYLALAPTPIPFIRALADGGKVFVRMYDNHDAPNDALFSLGNVSKIRSRLAEACEWDGPSTPSGNSAPNAPAPAAAPSAPRVRPK